MIKELKSFAIHKPNTQTQINFIELKDETFIIQQVYNFSEKGADINSIRLTKETLLEVLNRLNAYFPKRDNREVDIQRKPDPNLLR